MFWSEKSVSTRAALSVAARLSWGCVGGQGGVDL